MKKIKFDLRKYTRAQIVDAISCPCNRHCTRVEHSCDDFELYKHPEWLLHHYIENGGAIAFAKRRKEFEREIEEPEPPEYYI